MQRLYADIAVMNLARRAASSLSPNKALQQTLDPPVRLAAAKRPSASSAAELYL
jgi:hypothetical protein